jgi:hypothetical protein
MGYVLLSYALNLAWEMRPEGAGLVDGLVVGSIKVAWRYGGVIMQFGLFRYCVY